MAGHILVLQQIRRLAEQGRLSRPGGLAPGQLQPASLDLTLGSRGWRVRTGFLCEGRTVASRLAGLALFELDLTAGAVLELGHPYVLELAERLDLPPDLHARCNPRSSTGRLDIFSRVLADGASRFDEIPPGYAGPLYLEVIPRSFPIRIRAGQSLHQIRFATGEARLGDAELAALGEPLALDDAGRVLTPGELRIEGGLLLRVSLEAPPEGPPVAAYRARRFSGIVDLALPGAHAAEEFWEALPPPKAGALVLEPEVFYLLASLDRVVVPPTLAAEMAPFDVGLGELRTNYAGFFDSGFGPAPAVLEVRPHDAPFLIEHGQVLFRMEYFRAAERPERLYGEAALGSHYQAQGLALSRHFAPAGGRGDQ